MTKRQTISMGHLLRKQQTASGAQFDAITPTVPLTFNNDEEARKAAFSKVALCDRSHWGRIRVSDSDRIRFLHNQTTNQIQQLPPGQGCNTVFVNSTGRTLDLATVYVEPESLLLFVSPHQAEDLMEWMDRYIFFADRVKLANETDQTRAFTLIGPHSADLLSSLNAPNLQNAPDASHQIISIAGLDIFLAVDSGLALPGFTLIVAAEAGPQLWQMLATAATPLGERVWEQLRIEQGRPMPNAELTTDYNPLEAGLWHAVSFDKGCYIGQETIARLQTYQGVKQQLWGLRLPTYVAPGTPILLEAAKVGLLTSCVETSAGALGLGYIRTKAGRQGLQVTVGEVSAEVVELPFASRGYLEAPHS